MARALRRVGPTWLRAVKPQADKATNKMLGRFGAFVRSDAKRSIRKQPIDRTRKTFGKTRPRKPSRPGTPPGDVIGTLKRFVLFDVDQAKRNVIMGPAWLPRQQSQRTLELLEHGGVRRQRSRRHNRTVTARYPARPFMRPAFNKNTPQAARLLKNKIR